MKVRWISKCINQGFLSQPLWVLPGSCWGWTDSSFQSQVFSWEQTVFVIGHSCGSEKSEKMRLKTLVTAQQQQQRKQRNHTIKNCFVFFFLSLRWIENAFNNLLTQSLVPVSFEPYLLKSSPKHFGDQYVSLYPSKQNTFDILAASSCLSFLILTLPASPPSIRNPTDLIVFLPNFSFYTFPAS